jgi:hypothetical protein
MFRRNTKFSNPLITNFKLMRRTLLTLLMLCCIIKVTSAQDFPYGSISDDELDMKSYSKDTSAHAIVLHEYGKATIALLTDDEIRLVYEYHVKIKIFDNKGFDRGTVQIPVYRSTSNSGAFQDVQDITGVTYYRDDNGSAQKSELDAGKIYPVNENKHWSNYKFAMPGIRNGCVIEYKYKIISPYLYNFHPWYFQDYIPKVYSEYEAHIPAYWHYNISLKGALKLTKNTSSVEPGCFMTITGDAATRQGADCSVLVYGMSDIPAFVKEDYLTSPKNFLSAVNFVETDYSDPFNPTSETKMSRNWKDVDYFLKQDIYFGPQLKKASLFKDRIVPVIAGETDNLSKAKAVYTYIQHLFKYDGADDVESNNNINNAIDKHAGGAGDINLSLINALTAAGLNAKAVILSTRDHGVINSLYPDINDFDYVIARLDIGSQTYLLDATDPLLSFGMLPFKCLNGRGRVYSLDQPSDWIDINPPQKEKSTRTLDLILQDDGKLKGTYIRYSTSFDAYQKREAIKKFNSTDEYVEDFNSKSPKIKVLKAEIMNIDSVDQPLIEKYELEIDPHDKINGDNLVFNPFFWDRIDSNPFKLSERSYPVDLGMPSDERLILTIHLPEHYTVENPPQVVGISIPDNGGKFTTNYEAGDHSITFSYVIQLNNPAYDPGVYPSLKEFFNKIIQSEKAEIIFKKN